MPADERKKIRMEYRNMADRILDDSMIDQKQVYHWAKEICEKLDSIERAAEREIEYEMRNTEPFSQERKDYEMSIRIVKANRLTNSCESI